MFLNLPLLYMGFTPLVSHLYNYLDYLSIKKKDTCSSFLCFFPSTLVTELLSDCTWNTIWF